jgi:Tfp pilus assembly protein PilF
MLFARKLNVRHAVLLFAALAAPIWLTDGDASQAQTRAAPSRQSASSAAQSDAVVAEGVAAIDRGDLASARDLFEKALTLNPKSVEAHKYLGLLADRAGDLEGAEKHFAQAARLAPSSASARNNYGVILLRRGRTREAAEEFEASLSADPRQPNALVNLAQIRFESGKPEDLRVAASLFARADRIAPDAEIARALTVIALRQNDRDAAASYYQDYAARTEKEGSASSGDAAARAQLGSALLEAGLLREAETELKAAVNLEPSNAESIMQLARVYLARKDIPAAGRTLEGAVARGVDSAPLYALLAEVYDESGHPENAIPAMRLAIQRDPQSEKYRFTYGILLTNAYAPAAAAIRIEEALKSFPDSSRLWFALGLAYFKLDKDEESVRAFKRAVELDPKFATPYAYLGLINVKKGTYTEAVALYERALQAEPRLAVVHYLIAEALIKDANADLQRVESHLARALELDATFAPARLSLAKLYMRGERWADAAAELERVTKEDPDSTEAYYHLGRVYMRLKRSADAQAVLATYKRLSETQKQREDTELREVVKRLASVRF